jgi:hypothetical protein
MLSEGHSFSRAAGLPSLKGIGFSPYIHETERWALAPEGNAFDSSKRG